MFWDLVCLPLPLWIHQAAPGWQHTQANGGPALVFRVPSLEPQLALYLDSRRQGRAPSTPLGVPQSRMPTTMGLRSLPSVGRPAASCSQTCLS